MNLYQQVFTDCDGSLYYNWDVVLEVFPPGLVNQLFGAYQSLLSQLATDPDSWTWLLE